MRLYQEQNVEFETARGDFNFWLYNSTKQELLKGIEKRNAEVHKIIERIGHLDTKSYVIN